MLTSVHFGICRDERSELLCIDLCVCTHSCTPSGLDLLLQLCTQLCTHVYLYNTNKSRVLSGSIKKGINTQRKPITTVPLLNSPWSSSKNFRFRKFWRSYLDQNLLMPRRFYRVPVLKHPPMENALKIVKWSGTFTAKLKLP